MTVVAHYVVGKVVLGEGWTSTLPDIIGLLFMWERRRVPESDWRIRLHRWLHSPFLCLFLFLVQPRLGAAWGLHLLLDGFTHKDWRWLYPL